MKRKFRLVFKASSISFVIMVLAGCLGYLSVSNLKRNARLIVNDTLPGLSFAGEANAYLADASRTLLVIVTEDKAQQLDIREEIERLSKRTTGFLDRYGNQIAPEDIQDRANFQHLMHERTNYITIRNQILDLAMSGKKSEAMGMYNTNLIPAHKSVKKAGDEVFEFNMRQGEIRGQNILAICNVTQITVAILSVVVFIAGFFIGLFK